MGDSDHLEMINFDLNIEHMFNSWFEIININGQYDIDNRVFQLIKRYLILHYEELKKPDTIVFDCAEDTELNEDFEVEHIFEKIYHNDLYEFYYEDLFKILKNQNFEYSAENMYFEVDILINIFLKKAFNEPFHKTLDKLLSSYEDQIEDLKILIDSGEKKIEYCLEEDYNYDKFLEKKGYMFEEFRRILN